MIVGVLEDVTFPEAFQAFFKRDEEGASVPEALSFTRLLRKNGTCRNNVLWVTGGQTFFV